jgi:hypothetical protein
LRPGIISSLLDKKRPRRGNRSGLLLCGMYLKSQFKPIVKNNVFYIRIVYLYQKQ